MENIILLLLGLALSALGILNIKGNINTVKSWNRRKVRDEDIPKYGKAVGTGTLLMGISVILAFVISFWNEDYMGYVAIPGIILGLGFILYGQFKYNHGLL